MICLFAGLSTHSLGNYIISLPTESSLELSAKHYLQSKHKLKDISFFSSKRGSNNISPADCPSFPFSHVVLKFKAFSPDSSPVFGNYCYSFKSRTSKVIIRK